MSRARSSLASITGEPTKRRATKRGPAKRIAPRNQRTPRKRRDRPPAWAKYIFGSGFRETYLAHKLADTQSWKRFKEACENAFKSRKRAKERALDTSQRCRDLKAGGLAGFLRRAACRPRTDNDTFASRVREARPEIAVLSPKSQRDAIARERTLQRTESHRLPTHHATSIDATCLNAPLLRKWVDLGLDSTPHITETLLDRIEEHNALAWRYWQTHGMGRLFAKPWESLASLNRNARAVLCHDRPVLDLDMSACHHRIALAKGEQYNVADFEPLREYVRDPTAWRKRIEREAFVSKSDAKILGVILLNLGGLSTWYSAAEYIPQLSPALRA